MSSDSRRGFLAKCLGGAVALTAGNSSATETPATIPTSPEELFRKLKLLKPLHVETDFTPSGTKVVDHHGRQLAMIDELLIQFGPGQVQPWVGMNVIIPGNDFRFEGQTITPRLFYPSPDRNGDVVPQVVDEHGIRFDMMLHSLRYDHYSMISRAMLVGAIPVKITRPLKDLDVQFMRCAHCGHWNRILAFTPEECNFGHWQLGAKEGLNTAQRPCQRCNRDGAEQIDFHDEKYLYKFFLTPTTSHLVFDPDPRPLAISPDAANPFFTDFMAEIDSDNHPMWLAKETTKRPIAQLLPKPSPPNDVFLANWAPLFGLNG